MALFDKDIHIKDWFDSQSLSNWFDYDISAAGQIDSTIKIEELVSQRNSSSTAGATTIDIVYPNAPKQGNLLVAAISWRGNTTISSVPVGWSLATSGGNGAGIDSAIYYKIAGSSESLSHQWTLSVSNKSAAVASEWSGITALPLDKTSNSTNSTATVNAGNTGTLSQNDELIVCLYSAINIEVWTALSDSQTEIGNVSSTGGANGSRNTTRMAAKVVSSNAAANYTSTLAFSQENSGAVATFKQASSGSLINGITSQLTISGQTGQVSIGNVLSGIAANVSLSAINGTVSIGNTINGIPESINIAGNTGLVSSATVIDGSTSPLSLVPQQANISLGNILSGSVSALTLTPIPGTLLDTDTGNFKLIPPLTGIAHEINGVLASAEALTVYRQSFTQGGSLLSPLAGNTYTDTGYPVISSVTETTFATDTTSHAVSLPATINAGDGLLILFTNDGSATVTDPFGWKRLYSSANGTALRGSAFARVARGNEGGTTVDIVTSAAESGAAQVYRITNWNGSLAGFHAGASAQITTGTTADPESVSAYWGSAKNIWLATLHTSTSQTVSSGPTNYTDLLQTSSGASTTGSQCISARRSNEVATEDPGVFTLSGSGSSKVYNTIAIAPAYAGSKYEHFEITQASTTLWCSMYTSQPMTVFDSDITRAVIVLHGRGLDASEYANVVRKNLNDYLGRVIIVTPFFAETDSDVETDQLFWGTSWAELGRSSATLAWRISSGEILDQLISRLYTTFTNLEGVVIAGHSAGGQLSNRYSAASTDTRNRYLVSAASSYVYPGPERTNGAGGWSIPSSPITYNDYKYGLDNLATISYVDAIGATELRNRLALAKVTFMVGANDNDPADTSMDLTADAQTQGAHRVERQQLYYDYLKYYYSVVIAGQVGSLSITGQQGTLVSGIGINGIAANISLQPVQGSLLSGIIVSGIASTISLAAQTGSITIGNTLNGVPSSLSLNAQQGSVVTGNVLSGTPSSLLLNSQQGSVISGNIIQGSAATISINPVSGSISIGTTINSSSASIQLNAQQGTLTQGTVISSTASILSLAGVSGTVIIANHIAGTAANLSLIGVNGSVGSGVVINGSSVTINLSTTTGSLSVGTTISGNVNQIQLSGNTGKLSIGSSISSSVASISISGQTGTVIQGTSINGSIDQLDIVGVTGSIYLPSILSGTSQILLTGIQGSVMAGKMTLSYLDMSLNDANFSMNLKDSSFTLSASDSKFEIGVN